MTENLLKSGKKSIALETIPAFYFEQNTLEDLAAKHRASFAKAQPFPHIVIDNFLPDPILKLLIEEFPKPGDIDWDIWGPGSIPHSGKQSIEKIGTSNEEHLGSFTRHFMGQLNSATFLKFIENLTGESGVVPDPTYHHCGLHSTGRGGRLMIHTDVNRHPLGKPFDQRYNLILFLNEDWKEGYGGHLELWDKEVRHCERKILPIANRLVLFDTGTRSFHGHPHPLTCPEGRRRNSIAIYYYTVNRPQDENYKGHQNQVQWRYVTEEDKKALKRQNFRNRIKKILPPIVLEWRNCLKK